MNVHLIKKRTIQTYIRDHSNARTSFEDWLSKIRHADWESPEDIRKTFSSADILGGGSNRVVFNIGGNTYRLICTFNFGKKNVHLFVKWIGTHAEYDRLCNNEKQYTVDNY